MMKKQKFDFETFFVKFKDIHSLSKFQSFAEINGWTYFPWSAMLFTEHYLVFNIRRNNVPLPKHAFTRSIKDFASTEKVFDLSKFDLTISPIPSVLKAVIMSISSKKQIIEFL